MIRTFSCLALVPAVLLAACAQAPATPAVTAAPAVQMAAASAPAPQECHRETKPGSNLFITRCGPAADGDRSQISDQMRGLTGTGFSTGLNQR